MLPVTRANLDHICCICLLDVRPSVFTQKVYDVREENNLSKILKLTSQISILKNPINQKYTNDYCRKLCETCYIKVQYSYLFREKIITSIAVLKEALGSSCDLNALDIKRLQDNFCLICLNRPETNVMIYKLEMTHLNWIKNCSGIRFTSLNDGGKFRIKEGTNINEIVVINDSRFPQHLCQICLRKLQNVEEFRKSSTQSFEYMISVMGDDNTISPEDHLVSQEIVRKLKANEISKINKTKKAEEVFVTDDQESNVTVDLSCEILQIQEINIKLEVKEEEIFDVNVLKSEDCHVSEEDPIKSETDNPVIQQLIENDNFEYSLDFKDLPQFSDNDDENDYENKDDDDDDRDVDFNIDESSDEASSAELSDNAVDEDNCTRITRTKTQKECNFKNKKAKKSVEKMNRRKNYKQVKKSKHVSEKCKNHENDDELTNNSENDKGSERADLVDEIVKRVKSNLPKVNQKKSGPVACELCSKVVCSIHALRRHLNAVHFPDPNIKILNCPKCSKEFKRQSHLDDHIKTVHEKIRAFKCSHCDKGFTSSGSKKAHELLHTNEFPFACDFCGRRFRQSCRLKVHLEIHTTKPDLLCPICKRSQKTTQDLEEHLKTHVDKRLQCPTCGKFFNKNSHLKDHINAVHLKLRPFKCDFCELAFGDRKTKRVHEKSHTADYPELCTDCNRRFKSRISLGRHVKETGHLVGKYKSRINNSKKTSVKPNSMNYSENLSGIFELGTQYLANSLSF